jgi:hypothetical protein
LFPPIHTWPEDGQTGLALNTGAAGRTFTTNCASAKAATESAIAISAISFTEYFFMVHNFCNDIDRANTK